MTTIVWVSYFALWAIVITLALGFIALAKQIGLLYGRLGQSGARLENVGLNLGDRVASLDTTDILDRTVAIPSPKRLYTLLVFVAPSCSVCEEIAPAIAGIARGERHIAVILVSFNGDIESNRAYLSRHSFSQIPLILSPEFAVRFAVLTTPYSLLIDSSGIVRAKGLVNRREHLDSLINAAELNHESLQAYAMAERSENGSAQ